MTAPHHSPFPGMDPWLESHWSDVHTSIMTYARNLIQPALPDGLIARLQEYVAVEAGETDTAIGYFPDVSVTEQHPATSRERKSLKQEPGSTSIAEPIDVVRYQDDQISRELRIIDTKSGGKLVTTIEVLSPANKTPGKAGRFQRKQLDLLRVGSNLVEIDLLRVGEYVLSAPLSAVPESHRGPYAACVVYGLAPEVAKFYHLPLRERLPGIRIPLRYYDEEILLDLQALIDQAYVDGGYETLDYTQEPVPPLSPDDARWADELLRAAGKRK